MDGIDLEAPAVLSEDGRYRYTLRRQLGMLGIGRCVFVMLNPSTADATQDDPTIRRCVGFAAGWGYAELVVVNLFALRATEPLFLRAVEDPVGPANDRYIDAVVASADRVVCAWGSYGTLNGRAGQVLDRLGEMTRLWALGLTQNGQPWHPLYVKADTELIDVRDPFGRAPATIS